MDREQLEDYCRSWLAAWTGNDPEGLLAYFAPDTYYQDPGNPRGLRGHDALRPYFQKLLAVNPEWIWSLVELMPTARGFTLKWEANIPVGTETVRVEGLDIVELADGKIVRNEVYFDRVPLLEALQKRRDNG